MTQRNADGLRPVWVKLCGITRPEDAHCAIEQGVDALGFVFVPRSSRCLDLSQDLDWINALDGQIERVGLFMDAEADWIEKVLDRVSLDTLQFHGQESVDACEAWGLPYLKALSINDPLNASDWRQKAKAYASAKALLLDSHASGQMGGTGQVGDWQRLGELIEGWSQPWILAGGLNPDNVCVALDALKPAGIDLSSGIESQPGIKDHGKIEHLMRQLRTLNG